MTIIRRLELLKAFITGMKSGDNSVENRVLDIVIKRIDKEIAEIKAEHKEEE